MGFTIYDWSNRSDVANGKPHGDRLVRQQVARKIPRDSLVRDCLGRLGKTLNAAGAANNNHQNFAYVFHVIRVLKR